MEPQHCPTCQTEYVAGIAACADCGGPLTPGPLGRYTGAATASSASAAAAGSAAASGDFDAVLATLPGAQADQAVRALLLEEIPCFVECQGLTKTYQPGTPPTEPFAVTLPVTVHVRAADLTTAREAIDSLESDDLIGEQWSDEEIAEAAEAAGVPPMAAADDVEELPVIGNEPAAGAPEPQQISMVTVVVIVAVVIALLFIFGRQ